MSSVNTFLQIAIILGFPLIAILLTKRYKMAAFFSPIVLCFACGIIIANLQIMEVDEAAVKIIRDPAILLSLPLLLFSSDIKKWIRNSRHLIYGYATAVIATIIAVVFSAICYQHLIPEIWTPSGMMTGIHTGGTPNLFAVALATNAPDTIVTLTHSSQVLWGAVHLLFILSVGHRVYEYFLGISPKGPIEIRGESYVRHDLIKFSDIIYSIALASALIAISIGFSQVVFGRTHETLVIVSITTLAIFCSLHKGVRSWQGSFEAGDYLLLVFGVAVGMMSDLRKVMAEGGYYLGYVGVIFLITVVFMLIFCRLFRIKKDTAVIAITAAIYGPVFIPQVSQVLRNRSIIPGGIAISLIGLALGNYFGLLMATLLESLLG